MASITQILDKYQNFENDLKENKFWLFIPVYLLKTAIQYSLTIIIIIALLACFLFITSCLINLFSINYYLEEELFTIVCFSTFAFGIPGIYILLFSRKTFTFHPFIISVIFLFILFYFDTKTPNITLFLVALMLFVPTSLVQLIHYCLLSINQPKTTKK
ncbi:MAG: hypothetical protein AB1782_04605 [Cyanobacteriota bacterium]